MFNNSSPVQQPDPSPNQEEAKDSSREAPTTTSERTNDVQNPAPVPPQPVPGNPVQLSGNQASFPAPNYSNNPYLQGLGGSALPSVGAPPQQVLPAVPTAGPSVGNQNNVAVPSAVPAVVPSTFVPPPNSVQVSPSPLPNNPVFVSVAPPQASSSPTTLNINNNPYLQGGSSSTVQPSTSSVNVAQSSNGQPQPTLLPPSPIVPQQPSSSSVPPANLNNPYLQGVSSTNQPSLVPSNNVQPQPSPFPPSSVVPQQPSSSSVPPANLNNNPYLQGVSSTIQSSPVPSNNVQPQPSPLLPSSVVPSQSSPGVSSVPPTIPTASSFQPQPSPLPSINLSNNPYLNKLVPSASTSPSTVTSTQNAPAAPVVPQNPFFPSIPVVPTQGQAAPCTHFPNPVSSPVPQNVPLQFPQVTQQPQNLLTTSKLWGFEGGTR